MRIRVGRIGAIICAIWLVAFIAAGVTSTAAAWNTPFSGWQPMVMLLPLWLFFSAIPSTGLFFLMQWLWQHERIVRVKVPALPVVPRSWSRLSSAERYAECQREIIRLERENGIGL